jgi:acyl-CoA synthetase (AMP-forming)/AMP-acid ligase II
VKIDARDLALLPYSSGTSRPGQGVELTHATIVHNLAQTESLRIVQPDVMLGSCLYSTVQAVHAAYRAGHGATGYWRRASSWSVYSAAQDYRVTLAAVVRPIVLALARARGRPVRPVGAAYGPVGGGAAR